MRSCAARSDDSGAKVERDRVRQVLIALTHQLRGVGDDGGPPLNRLMAPNNEGPMGSVDRVIDLLVVQGRKRPDNFI